MLRVPRVVELLIVMLVPIIRVTSSQRLSPKLSMTRTNKGPPVLCFNVTLVTPKQFGSMLFAATGGSGFLPFREKGSDLRLAAGGFKGHPVLYLKHIYCLEIDFGVCIVDFPKNLIKTIQLLSNIFITIR